MSVINLSFSSSEDNLNPKYPNSERSRKKINCFDITKKDIDEAGPSSENKKKFLEMLTF
jgi:hypothetical protein